MKIISSLGIAAVIIALAACGQTAKESTPTDTPDNWQIDDDSKYSIQYPDTFTLDKSGQMSMSCLLLSKQISEQDLFRENVNVVIQNLAGQNIDLDKYVAISEGQFSKMMTNGILIESTRMKNHWGEFQKLVYTAKQGQFDLKWQQFYIVENEKAYVLTLTCEENQYDKYVDVGVKIMNSFKIK